ncbi:hypothetical protein PENNAL_c0020G08283 [Penicillium nalgiovense]|uniref:Uncharacterized protein n=1 Tax=Penicillium nalgiovense TaxID=60175 RepID=A0A1V6YI36_PENNA|nr:hypothetical protein PENNAL_c0020G08283 [Penicillium nalgiovense]
MLWSPFDEKGRQAATEATTLNPLSCLGNAATAAYYHRSAALPLESLQPLVYTALSLVILECPTMGAILPGTLQFIQLRDGRDEEVDALVEEQQNIMIHSPMSWHHADTARLLVDCSASTTTLTGLMQAVLAMSLFANLPSEFSTGWNMPSAWNEARRIHTASKTERGGKR